ncbi:L-aminoadipate-semialdehyde dehydrogenase [Annulohypoxylon maeteangense]|uniref:L-aminoadipate-semialdehyde dehydrogenase n=1 Tax=Annulohypoxylon maeteangense TaxID=1927788 RepID=UPI002007CB1F|nr:L-aminoadipate-semialdehyde dehydrogenase [Annulohypoxylon maeteangense]KAI0890390.1 L-aminoadipate-semialdehyde dehydrogenase [Annulohypoxylon maeteangense]
MSLAATTHVQPDTSNQDLSPGIDSEAIDCINDLIVNRAATFPFKPLLAYPAKDGKYVYYTANELDGFADEAAKRYVGLGLVPKNGKDESEIVALIGVSNLDYIISILALTRIGFGILFLSTRLSVQAYIALLDKTNCHNIVAAPNYAETTSKIAKGYEATRFSILTEDIYGRADPAKPRFQRPVKIENEAQKIAFILHSSGSTGLPKPIYQTHRSCLTNYSVGSGMRAFITLPLFHNHGLCTLFRGITYSVTTALFDASLPMTHDNLISAMEQFDPESFHCVPYSLKVLSESDHGIELMGRCKLVLFGGSSCPDDLGDKVVNSGVYLVGHYGATEVGQLMTSFRDKEDKAWNYVRPFPKVAPYLHFEPLGEGLYECVVLDGLPTKLSSNSDDPPNSFHTRDIFIRHPTIPLAFKYMSRLDDRVTLVNGEKVLPIPFEHRLRQHELVEEALIFGVDKAFPGLLIFPSEKARQVRKEDLLNTLRPVIDAGNEAAEKFGQISIDMVEILPCDTLYPRTDKGTIIRAAAYKAFEGVIEAVYSRFETHDDARDGARKALDQPELVAYLLDLFTRTIGVKGLTEETDFFECGADSLQAVTARAKIIREIDIGDHILSNNVCFEYPSPRKLASHLYSLRIGEELPDTDEIALMSNLIEKYSDFPLFIPGKRQPDGEVILLTGATGSLGAHILSQVASIPGVKKVYCLVRAKTSKDALSRVSSSLESRGLSSQVIMEKVVCLPSDFSQESLGLDSSTLDTLRSSLTTVIHSAWMVNFNVCLSSFERSHIAGVHNIIKLCLSVPFQKPANFFFVSSISAAAGTPIPAVIREAHINDLHYAQNMGYARSKLVTEYIIRAAAKRTGINARILRTGQLMGDSHKALWNPTEAIPLMIQSATTVGALPTLDETPSWLPVDKCAAAILELSGLSPSAKDNMSESSETVYHVLNPSLFSWSEDLLPALRDAGLEFETVSQREWVRRLRESEPDPQKNPPIKLLHFFEQKYDNDSAGRSGLVFETQTTARYSETIGQGFAIVGSGILQKCLDNWRLAWGKEY